MSEQNRGQFHDRSELDLHAVLKLINDLKRGEFSARIESDGSGLPGKIHDALNDLAEMHEVMSEDIVTLAQSIANGKTDERLARARRRGGWKENIAEINNLVDRLTSHSQEVDEVITSLTKGKLEKRYRIDGTKASPAGVFKSQAGNLNELGELLEGAATDIVRLSRQIGVDGQFGGRSHFKGPDGIWKEVADSLNLMVDSLTDQVRDVLKSSSAIFQGDLTQKIVVDCNGEMAELKQTINMKIDQLSVFCDQLNRLAVDVGRDGQLGGQAHVDGASGVWRSITDNVNDLARNLTNQVRAISEVATAVSKGDYTQSVQVQAQGEIASLRDNVNRMVRELANSTAINEQQDWLKTNLAAFTQMLQGERDLETVAQRVISELARVIDAQHGVFYIADSAQGSTKLHLLASYAYRKRESETPVFSLGQGLVGQCALEKKSIVVTTIPEDYIKIQSGLGFRTPRSIVVSPIIHEGDIKGVVELASFHEFTDVEVTFLDQFFETLATIVVGIESALRTEELLKQSQRLAEELQNQQEELQQTNEELEEKAREVLKQNEEVERKNTEVEAARLELEHQADALSKASKYKSEFLANMSHELRTPLNSLLILSQQLSENIEENLTEKQIEHAKTIYMSGRDLLSLINEVLDLAKIESGTMDINVSGVPIKEIARKTKQGFDILAKEKGLTLTLKLDRSLPKKIQTDEKRVMQVLRNLISNAIKFTATGSVTLTVKAVSEGWRRVRSELASSEEVIAFSVTDTGIGIEKDRQSQVFDAFQQADGGTSRRYGGTGLGLSISREIAVLLGGDLTVSSDGKKGSTFTFFLPVVAKKRNSTRKTNYNFKGSFQENHSKTGEYSETVQIEDDRDNYDDYDRKLLVIEDDLSFAEIIRDLAQEQHFGVLVAQTGEEGIKLAKQYAPEAITLDLRLPDMHGWVVLDRLKHDPDTRHIPVHVMSVDEDLEKGLFFGAIDILEKPTSREALESSIKRIANFVDRKVRNLLIVEDDEVQRNSIKELIGNSDVISFAVSSGEEALRLLAQKPIDCVVVDLKLPKMSGVELVHKIRESKEYSKLPIVIYTGRELTRRDELELRKLTESIIVKDADSPERLLDETALFLHRVESNLPKKKREILRSLYQSDPSLSEKKVLIVDDDARNIFATTSILERYDMNVFNAESGRGGIEMLEAIGDIDIVLMDIMMPEMDGFEAIKLIREKERFADLPIIALTAKAMPEDRAKCMQVGASDYIVKPVDAPQLVSLLRVWLYNR